VNGPIASVLNHLASANLYMDREYIMRKPLLAVAFFMISATAQADPYVRFAENDPPPAPPVVITTEPTEPTPAIQPKAVETKTVEPTKAIEPARAAEQKPAQPAPAPVAETKPIHTPKANSRVSRRETDEQKARRIAAKYGVYW
jgi:outer membrane biosynthesis protein TonB